MQLTIVAPDCPMRPMAPPRPPVALVPNPPAMHSRMVQFEMVGAPPTLPMPPPISAPQSVMMQPTIVGLLNSQ